MWDPLVTAGKQALSDGRGILLHGWQDPDPPFDFNARTLIDITGLDPNNPHIQWQCELLLELFNNLYVT